MEKILVDCQRAASLISADTRTVYISKLMILTPSAKDFFRDNNIAVVFDEQPPNNPAVQPETSTNKLVCSTAKDCPIASACAQTQHGASTVLKLCQIITQSVKILVRDYHITDQTKLTTLVLQIIEYVIGQSD